MQEHQIVAKRLSDSNGGLEHITHVKYDNAVHTRGEVIRAISARTDAFFVRGGGAITWVEVVHPGYPRDPYIRTRPDWTGKDNLLSLPDC